MNKEKVIKIDIIIVTYNSRKWISNCLKSISKSNYPKERISVVIVDNSSSDGTCEVLDNYNSPFGSFKLIRNEKNLGFGKANNIGAKHAISECLFFLNPDTEIHEDAIRELMFCFENDGEDIALWELRQFPYEHPKYYNPVTLETSWSSAAACMVRKSAFTEIGGFDENIFMYCEDVDLSWRLRLNGYKLKYVPKAIVYHYCYEGADVTRPTRFYNIIKYNILLRYKFGNLKDVLRGYLQLIKLISGHEQFPGSRKGFLKIFLVHFCEVTPFLFWKVNNKKKLKSLNRKFLEWDYEIRRDGAFYFNKLPNSKPLVSVVIRTIGRPTILKEALISIRNQTYQNIEVIIVEDGSEISKSLIFKEFQDLDIKYFSTKERIGRCKAGNLGLEKTNGKYIVFLDDDDVFFPEHIEVLVSNLENNEDFLAAYSVSFETPIEVESINPYIYKELFHNVTYRQPFNRLLLFHHNYIPIQTMMFNRRLYEELGGFDENLDLLEDWDLWVRYSLKTDFLFVPKLTSIYRVPADSEERRKRLLRLDDALQSVREKHKKLIFSSEVGKTVSELEMVMNSYLIRISEETIQKIFVLSFFVRILRYFKTKLSKRFKV